jgi:hypothetical protein
VKNIISSVAVSVLLASTSFAGYKVLCTGGTDANSVSAPTVTVVTSYNGQYKVQLGSDPYLQQDCKITTTTLRGLSTFDGAKCRDLSQRSSRVLTIAKNVRPDKHSVDTFTITESNPELTVGSGYRCEGMTVLSSRRPL